MDPSPPPRFYSILDEYPTVYNFLSLHSKLDDNSCVKLLYELKNLGKLNNIFNVNPRSIMSPNLHPTVVLNINTTPPSQSRPPFYLPSSSL